MITITPEEYRIIKLRVIQKLQGKRYWISFVEIDDIVQETAIHIITRQTKWTEYQQDTTRKSRQNMLIDTSILKTFEKLSKQHFPHTYTKQAIAEYDEMIREDIRLEPTHNIWVQKTDTKAGRGVYCWYSNPTAHATIATLRDAHDLTEGGFAHERLRWRNIVRTYTTTHELESYQNLEDIDKL